METAILEVADSLFGKYRIYLDPKRLIGKKGRTRNIPDGYLIDLSSVKEPKLFVVENELKIHDPLKHIAAQILEFSLSFETTQHRVKTILKENLAKNKDALKQCQEYAKNNGFDNVDYLLERMVYGKNTFNALVIIDELSDDLETVLTSRFQFPVEFLTLQRFVSPDGERMYHFDPFLGELSTGPSPTAVTSSIDPADIDTIVVPANSEGFLETFIGEDCWYQIRVSSTMREKIKYIAGYQTSPTSAITHVAPVKKVEQYKDTNKYIVYFSEPAREIDPIKINPKGRVKAPYGPRYSSMERIKRAKTLDDVF